MSRSDDPCPCDEGKRDSHEIGQRKCGFARGPDDLAQQGSSTAEQWILRVYEANQLTHLMLVGVCLDPRKRRDDLKCIDNDKRNEARDGRYFFEKSESLFAREHRLPSTVGNT
jgi:hypothetical protein